MELETKFCYLKITIKKSIFDENKVIILLDIKVDAIYENIIVKICLKFMP